MIVSIVCLHRSNKQKCHITLKITLFVWSKILRCQNITVMTSTCCYYSSDISQYKYIVRRIDDVEMFYG